MATDETPDDVPRRGPGCATPGGKLRPVDADRYADFRVLGQGGMGIVYWALDTDLNRQVAFKVVRPDAGGSDTPTPTAPLRLAAPAADTPSSQAFATLKARFLQEAWVTAGLEHPGIVPVYEVGRTDAGVPYYTMRFVRGSRTFAAAIDEARGRPIDERLALLDPFLRVCDTIRYAHAHGVIHRDLKPDNVALGEFGEVVVLDWGLAKMTGRPDAFSETWQRRLQEYRDAAELKTLASALGTPGYMSPEAALGRVAEVDARSDVYSLGAILFEVLAGRLPYEFRSYGELATKLMHEDPPEPSSIDASIPPELSAVCARALARDRAARPASVDVLAADVRAWMAQRAADRELDALREQAKAAFDAAAGLTGDLRLHQLDRAASACDQMLTKRAGDAVASALRREIDSLRAKGVEERASATRRTALRRAGIAALVFVAVAGAAVAKVLDDRRRELIESESLKTAALLRANGRRLVAEAWRMVASDPELALRLALEGAERGPGLAADAAIRAGLFARRELRRIDGAEFRGDDVSWSPDGRLIVYCDPPGRVFVRDAATGELAAGWPVRGVADGMTHAEFLGDGTKVGAWGNGGLAILAARDGTVLAQATTDPADGDVTDGCVAQDGSAVVVQFFVRVPGGSGRQTRVCRWDATKGTFGPRLVPGGDVYTLPPISPDARYAVGGLTPVGAQAVDDDRVTVVDLATGAVVTSRHVAELRCVGFVGDEAVAISRQAPREKQAGVEDEEEPSPTLQAISIATGAVRAEAPIDAAANGWIGMGGGVVILSDETADRFWDVSSGLDFTLPEQVASSDGSDTAISPDRRFFARVAGDGNRVELWDLRSNSKIADLVGHTGSVRGCRFSPDSTRLGTISQDGSVRIWDACGARAAFRLRDAVGGHPGQRRVAFAADGSRIVVSNSVTGALFDADTGLGVSPANAERASVAADGTSYVCDAGEDLAGPARRIEVRDTVTGSVLRSFVADLSWTACTGISPDGRWVVAASQAGAVHAFDTTADVPPLKLEHAGTLTCAPFAEGGRVLLVADSARVSCRELPSGRERWAHPKSESPIVVVAGDVVAIGGSRADTFDVVEVASGRRVRRIEAPGHAIASLDATADGRFAVSGGEDGTARVWDLADGRCLRVLEPRAGRVDGVRFDATGRRAVVVSAFSTATVWDVGSGRLVARLDCPSGAVSDEGGWSGPEMYCTFSPDGTRVAVALWDRAVYVWPVDAVAAVRAAPPRALTPQERVVYLPPADADGEQVDAAGAAVRRLLDELALVADVRDALRRDATLDGPTRAVAELLLEGRSDDADDLNGRAWPVVATPAVSAAERERALRWAAAAARLAPGDVNIANTLGVAEYRCGKFVECAATLTRCDAENSKSAKGPQPSDIAFLAMALHRLGRTEEAKTHFDRLRGLMAKPPHAAYRESLGFLAEAAALIDPAESEPRAPDAGSRR